MTDPLTIAVTGATGFVGEHLVRRLRAVGHTVRALTRRPQADATDPNLIWVEGSLEDGDSLRKLNDGADVLVHGAGAIKALSRKAFFEINRDGTRHVLTAALAAKVPRMTLISSLAAREPALSPYAASKRAAELVVAEQAQDIETTILRPPAIYGPGDQETARLFQMVANGFVLAAGRRDAALSLIHVGDVVSAIQACCELAQPGAPLEIDDGAPGGHTWQDIADTAGHILGRPQKLIHLMDIFVWLAGGVGTTKGLLTRSPAMLTLAKVPELLHPDWLARGPVPTGWAPEWSLERGFDDAIDWYSSQNILKRYL